MELPPLRERPEDIKELASYHVAKMCDCYDFRKKGFSTDFFDVLSRYEWPGNVRELVNALERAVSAAGHEPVIFPKHLPIYIRVQLARASVAQGQEPEQAPHERAVYGDNTEHESSRPLPRLVEMRDIAIAEVEQRYLRELMTLTKDMHEACRISGMSRSRLYALLKKYDLPSCFRI
jgi:two-component system NtrC family response regulator